MATRLLLSLLLVPLVPPGLLLLSMRGTGRMTFGDWMGIGLLYGAFGLAALLALGMPLLIVWLRLGWTGFLPFMAGGGLCAGVTSYAVLRGVRDPGMVGFFTVTGIVSGLVFRLLLFGTRRNPAAGESSSWFT
jgi:hypothetical protein